MTRHIRKYIRKFAYLVYLGYILLESPRSDELSEIMILIKYKKLKLCITITLLIKHK